jgi:pteridine reductase
VQGHAHYSVSKAGLAMLVKAMAVELAPAVRTVGISPGQVAWPESYAPELRERLTRRIPLRRVGTPEDVAALVRFVALEGHYLNGVVLPLDGGLGARY